MNKSSLAIAVTALLAVGYLGYAAFKPAKHDGAFDYAAFGRVPVVMDGRVKPLDTVARSVMLVLSEKQTYRDTEGDKRPAIEWLADVMTIQVVDVNTMTAEQFAQRMGAFHPRIVRITNPQVQAKLDLEPHESFRYPLAELIRAERWGVAVQQARIADNKRKDQRSMIERKMIELANRLALFDNLAAARHPLVVPPAEGGGEWMSLADAEHVGAMRGEPNPYAASWRKVLLAHRDGDAPAFNAAVNDHLALTARLMPAESRKAGHEAFFNRFAPFYQCMVLSVAVGLLALLGLMCRARPLTHAAETLSLVVLLVWLGGLIARMYFQDRPMVFVTNLYSSAVFVGWVTVLTSLVVERIFKLGVGPLIGAGVGFLSLLVAHHLAAEGDTLEMMQAVLDTNFWLATHVTTVTIGYGATFFAGALGICYLLGGVLLPGVDQAAQRAMARMMYGIICFALLFSFVGTVTGGIWADQSWGRFWGWDVKENGALIIVLWNALILHARWGGIARQRGIALLAVFGNVVTAWSWFGVNQLDVGLHTYGSTDSARFWLLVFALSQLAVIAVGLVPQRLWASQRKTPAPPPLPG